MKLLSTNNVTLNIFFVIVMFMVSSCKKLIQVDAPINKTTQENVYNSDANAIAVLTGIYAKLSQADLNSTQITGMPVWTGLYSDELIPFDQTSPRSLYYTNTLDANSVGNDFWNNIYPLIFTVNSALEGLANSTNLSSAIKQQLIGEAKFLRAFFYFYLVNLYGDIPLATSTDWKINTVLSRSSKEEVYEQIKLDLIDAQNLLSASYLDKSLLASSLERIRPTKWAATALLARTYLFTNDWLNAESQATTTINYSLLYDTVSINNVFLKNNKEAIWQLQPVNSGRNTQDAWLFKLLPSGPDGGHPFYLSTNLLNSFEPNDQRKTKWVDSVKPAVVAYYYPAKYDSAKLNAPVMEYSVVFRLAELYLIRAEARAQQNKISEALADLNVIRKRAGLPNTTANDKTSLLTAILHERQVELFTEWGHRWFDLKRTGKADTVLGVIAPQKGSTWASFKQLFPISLNELSLNPNLSQNTGY